MKLTQAQIDTACNWWANSFIEARHDNGGDGFAGVLTDIIASRYSVTNEQLASFRSKLADILADPNMISGGRVWLSSDYGPDQFISGAMNAAGIHESRCPWKSCMWINQDGSVKAQLGYRGEVVTLLEATQTA